MFKKVILLFFLLSCQTQNPLLNNKATIKILTESGAWCWFSDPRAVYFEGEHQRTYAGWVSNEGDIVVGFLDHTTGEITSKIIHENFQKDDHNVPSLLFLPDGRLRIFYTAHNGPYHTTVTKNPEDISSWETTKILDFGQDLCYSNPVLLKSENNKMYVFWRGDDWRPTFSTSMDLGETWTKPQALIEEIGRDNSNRPYMKIDSDGESKIHFAFTDGHPRNEPQNSIYYLYYEAGKFFEANGKQVATLNELPIRPSQLEKVYDATQTNVRAWIWDVAIDEDNLPTLVYTRLPSEVDHRYYYAKWNGTRWIDSEISPAGKWFPETPDGKKEFENHYSGGIILDHSNTNQVYFSKPVGEIFEIFRATTKNLGRSWNVESITQNSSTNQVRPFVPRNNAKHYSVIWMDNYGGYIHYRNYESRLLILAE